MYRNELLTNTAVKNTANENKISQEQIDSLAASFYPVMLEFFERERGKQLIAEYEAKKKDNMKSAA